MKRCKFCGHPGRLTAVYTPMLHRPDGYKCTSPLACIRRMQQVGQWIGKRVLRRIDANGTEWTIRRHEHLGALLTMTYLDHRLTSVHRDFDAAKAHADDLEASMADRDIDAYREPVADDQMELL